MQANEYQKDGKYDKRHSTSYRSPYVLLRSTAGGYFPSYRVSPSPPSLPPPTTPPPSIPRPAQGPSSTFHRTSHRYALSYTVRLPSLDRLNHGIVWPQHPRHLNRRDCQRHSPLLPRNRNRCLDNATDTAWRVGHTPVRLTRSA